MTFWLNHITPFLSILEYVILAVLILLGALILLVFFWRFRVLSKARGNPGKWISLLTSEWDKELEIKSDTGEQDAPARLVRTGMANLEKVPDALEKILEAQEMAEKRELEKGAAFLGTVGANAPFVGLAGTVLGILSAFQRFAETSGHGSTEVMAAISRALVATALGLLVAIPAVIFYNIIRSKIRAIINQDKELQALFVARSLHASCRKEP
jgi:biopolymer transport protein ExbB/TolQ